MHLKNSVALITGGSSGIGRAIAQSLAASGARVAITGRDKDRLTKTARELGVHPIHAGGALVAVGQPQALAVDGYVTGRDELEVRLERRVRRGHHHTDPFT